MNPNSLGRRGTLCGIKLRAGLRGALIDRSDAGYDEARKLYNGMIDKRPRMIARCADVADVIAAVRCGLPVRHARP